MPSKYINRKFLKCNTTSFEAKCRKCGNNIRKGGKAFTMVRVPYYESNDEEDVEVSYVLGQKPEVQITPTEYSKFTHEPDVQHFHPRCFGNVAPAVIVSGSYGSRKG